MGDPVVTVEFHYMTDIDWLAGREDTIIHVWWPVMFKGQQDQLVGRFVAVMWENLADPIITGRAKIGQPKLYAEIPELRAVGASHRCEASWMAFRFLDVRVTGRPTSAHERNPGPAMQGKEVDGSAIFHRATWRNLPTMPHVVNALADLPVLSSRGGLIATTRDGKSHRDRQILT